MERDQPRPSASLARYGCLAAWIGIGVGLVEAQYLYWHSRPLGLLIPDGTGAIWLWGPLLDGAAGLLIGLGCGLLIIARPWERRWPHAVEVIRGRPIATVLTGIAMSVVVAYAMVDNVFALRALKVTAALLLLSLANKIGRALPLKTLAASLGSTVFLLLSGVGMYSVRLSLHGGAASGAAHSIRARPNIILITLDTVRADHLSLYGYSRQTTPNLDRWGRQGVVFEDAIAPTSWTLASHASMFTGMLPHQHGADWLIPLNTRRWTLADVLSSWGYETAGFTSNFVYGGAGWGLDEGFDSYEDYRESVPHIFQALKLCSAVFEPFYRHWVLPEYFERREAPQANADILGWFHHRSPRPFFLFVNYFDAHDPYLAPEPYSHRFGQCSLDVIRRTKLAFAKSHARVSDPDKTALIAGYDNSLAYLDHAVGQLLDTLSRFPGWENTVVILTSDHGEGFGEHGTFSHGENLYREALRVPLIVFGPGIPKGRRVARVVATQDLFATVLDFAGDGVAPFRRDGLQRYWTSRADFADSDEPVIAELTPKYRTVGLWPEISLRTTRWTYIRNSRGDEELYDWRRDPGEQDNLAASAAYGHVLEELRARLCGMVAESLRPWQGPQYLSALDEPSRPFLNVADSTRELVSGQRLPGPPIGDAQIRFPLKPVVSSRTLRTPETDLLQSLPYN